MCGIAGIVRHDGAPVDPGGLAAMARALRHRGPDGAGVLADACAGLAHARLSIVDPLGGAQPMSTAEGRYVIVYNGETYGHAGLRLQLEARGRRFRTRCDTEAVLEGFALWGEGVLERLNGQFAFAVWDRVERTLFLARDPFGVRPLYYAELPGALCFGSEPAALFASGLVDPAPDPRGVDEVFTFWGARAPRTVFRGVRQLPPGGCGWWKDGALRVRRWWTPDFPDAGEETGYDADAALRELDARMRSAVAMRMRADVPVGAYLSGGLDSSSICALAAPAAPGGLRTLSLTFTDAALDEAPFQHAVASALGTAHEARPVDGREMAAVFPDAVRHAATPLPRTAPAPMYLLARLARERGLPVVLTGEGADELFLGYDLFREAAVRRFCLRRPGSPRREALFARLYPYLAGPRGEFWRRWFLAANDVADPLFSHLPRLLLTRRIRDFYAPEVRAELAGFDPLDELRAELPERFGRWAPAHRAAWLELVTLLEPYLLSSQGDRMSMAHGVEGRYPFLDPHVWTLAASLPVRAKLAGLREKAILRRWAAPLLPPSVLARSKQPYRAPDAAAFLGAAGPEWVDDALSPAALRHTGWWEPRAVAGLVARCRAGRATGTRESQALAAVLSTQLWHRAYFDRRAAHPCLPLSASDPLGAAA
jgi:asparagine synthase (glutamine-hydrolysing)